LNDKRTRPPIPKTVWLLGIVSLLMDVSTEMVQTLLPVYLVSGLGISAVMIGLIEGAAVTIAMVTRLFAGVLSDFFQKRKTLTLIGYGLGALSKPLFPLADTALGVFGAKFVDRVGKGIRSAPRDAMIADVSPPEIRGASFGLRKSLDTAGGFLGPLIAIAIMLASGDNIKLVFWLAVVPALAAIFILAWGIREPNRVGAPVPKDAPRKWTLADAARLNRGVWIVITLAMLMSLARFSEAFLLLRANQTGWSLAWLPLIIVLLHLVYGMVAYPAGRLFDRIGPRGLLFWGMACLIGADLALAAADGPLLLVAGIALWGVHMGLTQGVLATLIAQTTPAHLKGTAFGVLSFGTAIAVLVGNLLAGVLWETAGAAYTFLAGAGLSLMACVGVVALTSRLRD